MKKKLKSYICKSCQRKIQVDLIGDIRCKICKNAMTLCRLDDSEEIENQKPIPRPYIGNPKPLEKFRKDPNNPNRILLTDGIID